MDKTDNETRQRILQAALNRFAHCGYAGVSVQEIVDDAQVTKPTLYYYFQSKADLYRALLDRAHDERFRLMTEASSRTTRLAGQLTEILAVLFEFLKNNRQLMRLAFATAFAAPGEIPEEINYLKKCERNFEFVHSLIKKGLATGELDKSFSSEELAMGIYGLMSIHVMAYLVDPKQKLTREMAARVVQLYLRGAGKRKSSRVD